MLVLALAVGCGVPPASTVPVAPAEIIPLDPQYLAATASLRATLSRDGIALDTQPVLRTCDEVDPAADCARCDLATVEHGIEADLIDRVAIAFARYPTSVRRAARLERVALCRTLHYERGANHGPAGMADPWGHRVYISVEYFLTSNTTSFEIEDAVHHEVFHLLDFEMLGSYVGDDRPWLGLNPVGFAYAEPKPSTTEPPGFVNSYATTNQVEDRASTWQYLMVRPTELCARAGRDPVLAAKVRMLWQRVSQLEGADRLGVTVECARPATPAKGKRAKGKRTDPGKRTTKLRGAPRIDPSSRLGQ